MSEGVSEGVGEGVGSASGNQDERSRRRGTHASQHEATRRPTAEVGRPLFTKFEISILPQKYVLKPKFVHP